MLYDFSDFKTAYLAQRPYFVDQVNSEILAALKVLPFLNSLESLLGHWSPSIQVHLPDLRDESSSLDTDTESAMTFYDQGMGLLFNDAQLLSPMLEDWLQDLRKVIGVSLLTYGRNLIYATPHGQGTAAHFDQNINFVLQLKGIKRWKIATNRHLLNPMTRHTIGQPVDPEMLTYLETPMPTRMPQDAESFELRPGSLLYVPRGSWHSTEAEGDALALNFTFTAPTWIDLLTAALRGRLITSPEWRETADLSEDKFNALLRALIQDVPEWRAKDILAATEAFHDQ